ncbi:hypothetical protein BH23CHL5_BH23CHL5_28220 [soil metagenome]
MLLADAAQDDSGKLSLLGAGWNTIWVRPGQPLRHRHLALAGTLEFDWGETNQKIDFSIDLIDEDSKSILPSPVTGHANMGRPVTAPAGQPLVMPLVINFDDLEFPRVGTYCFTFSAEDTELKRVMFHVLYSES